MNITVTFILFSYQQELTDAYEREAETLVSTLGDGAVTRREIIADVNALGDLALLCETMVCLFCEEIKFFIGKIDKIDCRINTTKANCVQSLLDKLNCGYNDS